MERKVACCCENCKRQQNAVNIERYSVQGHTAYLCPTCAYVLLDEKQLERFFNLCRQPVKKEPNREMLKVHKLLSRMIIVGVCLVGIVATWGVTQREVAQLQTTLAAEQTAYLSLAEFQRLNID